MADTETTKLQEKKRPSTDIHIESIGRVLWCLICDEMYNAIIKSIKICVSDRQISSGYQCKMV